MSSEATEGAKTYDFFRLLAVCSTVKVEIGEDGERNYQASSPDELALL